MLVTFLNFIDCSSIGKLTLLTLLFLSSISSLDFVFSASSEIEYSMSGIKVDFTSIQQAINEAENGSTVFVPSGIYFEHLVVNKSVSLVGENASTTIIDGGSSGTVVTVVANNATIAGFTIRNSGWGWTRNGVYVHYANYTEIRNNLLIHNCHNIRLNYSYGSHVEGNVIQGDGYGIRLIHSVGCVARNNSVYGCIGGVHLEYATNCTVKENYFAENSQGIRLYSPCTYNKIVANVAYNNSYEGMIEAMPQNTTFFSNVFFHNNFINNTNPFIYKVSGNIWDDGYPSGGNYWSDYVGFDQKGGPYQNITGTDGIGDTPYTIDEQTEDQYPLIEPIIVKQQ